MRAALRPAFRQNIHQGPVGKSYLEKITDIQPGNQLVLWTLNETAGSTIVNYLGDTNFDGAWTGVTLADKIGPSGEYSAPYFDGVNDFGDVFSTSLSNFWAASNPDYGADEMSIALWAWVADWGEGVRRRLCTFRYTAAERFYLERAALGDRLDVARFAAAGNGLQNQSITPVDSDWVPIAVTISEANSRMRVYYNNAQIGSDISIGAWAGEGLQSNLAVIGANSTTPTGQWLDYISTFFIFKTELTLEEVQEFGTV